jgi:hypothetical protein
MVVVVAVVAVVVVVLAEDKEDKGDKGEKLPLMQTTTELGVQLKHRRIMRSSSSRRVRDSSSRHSLRSHHMQQALPAPQQSGRAVCAHS